MKMMPAVEKFSPTMSRQTMAVSPATHLKASIDAPPVFLSRKVAKSIATVPTRVSLANSDGWMVMPAM